MVCEKSLYCWKNGPCASDKARKQIWEDNIRFRENLRDINQSDHYWSFQISKNSCLCLAGELFRNRQIGRKYRSGSLQNLNDFDCTSITHDFNGLKLRNCYVHCPIHNAETGDKQDGTRTPQFSVTKQNVATSTELPRKTFRPLHKSNEDKPEYCRRYDRTFSHSNLKPATKIRFSSQTNLTDFSKRIGAPPKKLLNSSCQDIMMPEGNQCDSQRIQIKENSVSSTEHNELSSTTKLKARKSITKVKKIKKELNPVVLLPSHKSICDCAPLSRTTRKLLCQNKKVPFVTFGSNNKNLNIGSKKTHNVLASKSEVYPNALAANQHKKELLLKCMQREREFQKKCLPESLKKRVNHSSLWSIENEGNEIKSSLCESTRHVLPVMSKPQNKANRFNSNLHSFSYPTYRKPEIHFY